MRIAVTSTVIFEVPEGRTTNEIKVRFLEAHLAVIGRPMETLTGQPYVLRSITRLDVDTVSDSCAEREGLHES